MSICYCQRTMGTSRNQKSPSESSERLPAACRNVEGLPQRSLSKHIALRLGICPEQRLAEMFGYGQHDGQLTERFFGCQGGFCLPPPHPHHPARRHRPIVHHPAPRATPLVAEYVPLVVEPPAPHLADGLDQEVAAGGEGHRYPLVAITKQPSQAAHGTVNINTMTHEGKSNPWT
jgi:hypothetical protein